VVILMDNNDNEPSTGAASTVTPLRCKVLYFEQWGQDG
jgi:hypothetical protein